MHLPRRFDDALMHAPDDRGSVDDALLVALRGWCEEGAFPVLTEPLRMASIAPRADLDAAARVLDGGHELARSGRWRGLLWRLQILWQEHATADRPADAFRPRRATLLMLREPAPAVAAALLATLHLHGPAYTKPLRVLVVSAVPIALTGPRRACMVSCGAGNLQKGSLYRQHQAQAQRQRHEQEVVERSDRELPARQFYDGIGNHAGDPVTTQKARGGLAFLPARRASSAQVRPAATSLRRAHDDHARRDVASTCGGLSRGVGPLVRSPSASSSRRCRFAVAATWW
jgi:hypothetical protein